MELKAVQLQTVGVLYESLDPSHVSKQVPSVGPLKKKKQEPCLISRSAACSFINSALCFDCFRAACAGHLPSAGNMLFHLCGLCLFNIDGARRRRRRGRKWVLCALKGLSESGEQDKWRRRSVLGCPDPVDCSGSMVKDWNPLNSHKGQQGRVDILMTCVQIFDRYCVRIHAFREGAELTMHDRYKRKGVRTYL